MLLKLLSICSGYVALTLVVILISYSPEQKKKVYKKKKKEAASNPVMWMAYANFISFRCGFNCWRPAKLGQILLMEMIIRV